MTQNCRTWVTENPFGHQSIPLHSEKVTLWCEFTASYIVWQFFFEETGPVGPVSCSVNGIRYESLLRNHVIPNKTEPHIANPVKCLLSMHFGNDRIISP
ncbi:hypothetical protein AVEN_82201-1 [Araneus ventricosus]|uniref:Uncharacterized protein n=1 Tax=Araneus ventricosus TaxID=182803 RepID=A0A4Y2JJS4_ARAVE|nr:hypothetical protein AVEN_82201-1 [Araneus ventricosus]